MRVLAKSAAASIDPRQLLPVQAAFFLDTLHQRLPRRPHQVLPFQATLAAFCTAHINCCLYRPDQLLPRQAAFRLDRPRQLCLNRPHQVLSVQVESTAACTGLLSCCLSRPFQLLPIQAASAAAYFSKAINMLHKQRIKAFYS